MNVQLIFTTSVPDDFATVLAHLLSLGIKPQVTASPTGDARERNAGSATGNGKPAKSPWEASPAVQAFRNAGMQRLKPERGETPHQAALRRLNDAGAATDHLPQDWQPTESAPWQDETTETVGEADLSDL